MILLLPTPVGIHPFKAWLIDLNNCQNALVTPGQLRYPKEILTPGERNGNWVLHNVLRLVRGVKLAAELEKEVPPNFFKAAQEIQAVYQKIKPPDKQSCRLFLEQLYSLLHKMALKDAQLAKEHKLNRVNSTQALFCSELGGLLFPNLNEFLSWEITLRFKVFTGKKEKETNLRGLILKEEFHPGDPAAHLLYLITFIKTRFYKWLGATQERKVYTPKKGEPTTFARSRWSEILLPFPWGEKLERASGIDPYPPPISRIVDSPSLKDALDIATTELHCSPPS